VVVGKGTLNLYGIDPYTLDPAVASEATSHSYVTQIFGGLVKLDDNLEPAPDIAERWEISPDFKTYTFYLRQNATFHDGRKVTAADFKYSWDRAANPATGSNVVGTYLGDIAGIADVMAGKAKEISGVEIIDDYTLRVTIDEPKSYFLAKLTYPTTFVVDKANVAKGSNWWLKPNGTGPFKLKEWQQNSLLVLSRNDKYHGQVAGVASVEFHLWAGVPMNLYEMGEIDVAGINVVYIDRVTDTSGPFYKELQITPELSFTYLGFNTTRPPFDDINIRQAFTMALDKDKMISLAFRNLVQRADGILPPGIPGYNPDLKGLGFDISRAKQLISASKYGDVSKLPPVTLTTSGYGGGISSTLQAMVVQWRENLGVEVTIRELEPEWYIYNLKEEKDEMFDMGWIADYPHPQDFLDVLFHTGAENNFSEYSNPAIDSLLDKASVETDEAKSLEMYRQAEQMLVDDAACLPLWFGQNYILVKPYVKGYKLNPMGFAWLNQVWIDK
jgi:oligopeptide transport system substrate-binding protein